MFEKQAVVSIEEVKIVRFSGLLRAEAASGAEAETGREGGGRSPQGFPIFFTTSLIFR